MNLASLIPAALGLIGGFGKRSGPSQSDLLYGQYSHILDEAMKVYNNTDLEAIDKASLDTYSKESQRQANEQMNNYQAQLSANGYDPEYYDTEKSRAQSRFAQASARDTAAMKADLDRTRAQRKLALLPSPQSVAGGFNMAAYADQRRDNLASAQYQSLIQLGSLIAPLLNGHKGKSSDLRSLNMNTWA